MLLGDVGEIEEMREGARERRRRIYRKLREQGCEFRKFRVVTRVGGFRQRAHAFDGLEQLVPATRSQRLAKKFPQQPHIVAQRLVGIGEHLFIVEQIQQRDRLAANRRFQRWLQIR